MMARLNLPRSGLLEQAVRAGTMPQSAPALAYFDRSL
jgi:hypothetical protein